MKLNLGKRLILFVYWLASLIVLAMLVIPQYANIALSYVKDLIPAAYTEYAVIALLSIYLLLGLSVLCMVFKRSKAKRSDRGFITVDSADSGKVRISISAIEQMVKQAAHTVSDIADMKISISNADDAIDIGLNVTMISGSHVPTVTLNLQRAIRQYVEMNSGVAVRSVSVSIQSVVNPGEGGKKGKHRDVKTVQEWNNDLPSPVAVPEQEYPVSDVQVEEPVYESVAVCDEMTVAAEECCTESAEEPVSSAMEDDQNNEKEEN